jgi:glycosyltransferase involved in cell wall biosynthesis
VARLTPQKGIPLLLEAAGVLKRRGRDFHLTLVGDGELRKDLEEIIITEGLAEYVSLAGWADSDTVNSILQASRAMVLPSFAEGLPVVIMEALALRRPVIVTSIAGTPELVDAKCGWLIPAGSLEDLVSAMEEALDAAPEQLNQMGECGRQRVLRLHDSRENGRQLAALFRSGGTLAG